MSVRPHAQSRVVPLTGPAGTVFLCTPLLCGMCVLKDSDRRGMARCGQVGEMDRAQCLQSTWAIDKHAVWRGTGGGAQGSAEVCCVTLLALKLKFIRCFRTRQRAISITLFTATWSFLLQGILCNSCSSGSEQSPMPRCLSLCPRVPLNVRPCLALATGPLPALFFLLLLHLLLSG